MRTTSRAEEGPQYDKLHQNETAESIGHMKTITKSALYLQMAAVLITMVSPRNHPRAWTETVAQRSTKLVMKRPFTNARQSQETSNVVMRSITWCLNHSRRLRRPQSIHPDRAVGSHRDHRDPDWPASACRPESAGGGQSAEAETSLRVMGSPDP